MVKFFIDGSEDIVAQYWLEVFLWKVDLVFSAGACRVKIIKPLTVGVIMKVYQGPYTDWWIGPYQLAGLFKYVGLSEAKTEKLGLWLDSTWVSSACHWVYNHNPLAKRKIRVHIDSFDTWNMDSTLAVIILPMLKQLRNNKEGIPSDITAFKYDSNSAQRCFKFYEETNELVHDAAIAEWESVLDEMIWTFEQIQPGNDWEQQYHKKKFDQSGWRLHQQRIDAGLESFGKHYQTFWE